ncbi:MAG: DUF2974 domain-containing protein [Deltaproteobacteria bacterium]|nr:DUF2974 domain-containing protein [Deltaproteobacteria bacterium]
MTTQFDIDCALIAGVAYRSTRDQIYRIPPPDGWTEVPLSHVTMPSGFEAVSFQRNNEIVISFAGANPEMFDPDWLADCALTTGLACSQQLKEATAYYLEIKKTNSNAQITFTGHSLGGGLAALLGATVRIVSSAAARETCCSPAYNKQFLCFGMGGRG